MRAQRTQGTQHTEGTTRTTHLLERLRVEPHHRVVAVDVLPVLLQTHVPGVANDGTALEPALTPIHRAARHRQQRMRAREAAQCLRHTANRARRFAPSPPTNTHHFSMAWWWANLARQRRSAKRRGPEDALVEAAKPNGRLTDEHLNGL